MLSQETHMLRQEIHMLRQEIHILPQEIHMLPQEIYILPQEIHMLPQQIHIFLLVRPKPQLFSCPSCRLLTTPTAVHTTPVACSQHQQQYTPLSSYFSFFSFFPPNFYIFNKMQKIGAVAMKYFNSR